MNLSEKVTWPAMLVLVSPYIAAIAAFLIIYFGIRFYRMVNRRALEPWSGRHYSFDDCKIRFYLHENIIWIPEADLRKVMRPEITPRETRALGVDYGIVPNHTMPGLTETGLLRLVTTRTNHRRVDPHMINFRNWLEKQALPNVRRLPDSAH